MYICAIISPGKTGTLSTGTGGTLYSGMGGTLSPE